MFESLSQAPDDPILGLTDAFQRDSNPAKINLSVGVYKDEQGQTPVLRAVKAAEERLLKSEATKNYLGIGGSPAYASAVQELLLAGHEALSAGRVATVHTPGGTGALRVAADFLRVLAPARKVWLSTPTWPNHPNVFQAAGLAVGQYPYFDAATNGLAWEPMLAALRQVPAGDVVLLHGCCHNPTGIDPTVEQWRQIAAIIRERGLLPLVDFAYQGLADGLAADAAGLRELLAPGTEALVASSFSKNFGLYNERVGALSIVASNRETAGVALSQVKTVIRANYSNPPAHGAAIVTTVLGDAELRADWERELTAMRDRIAHMRRLFVATLRAKGIQRDCSFIERQKGMFSFSGLNAQQVEALRKKYAIYIVSSGRINVAGMSERNMDPLCAAIADVMAG